MSKPRTKALPKRIRKAWADQHGEITSVQFAASLIAGIVKWAEKEGPTDLRDPAAWADRCRLSLLGWKPTYTA